LKLLHPQFRFLYNSNLSQPIQFHFLLFEIRGKRFVWFFVVSRREIWDHGWNNNHGWTCCNC